MQSELAAVGQHLGEAATRYFPELRDASLRVELRDQQERPGSRLYVFELGGSRKVLVKIPVQREEAGAIAGREDRVRLNPITSGRLKHRYEHSAMQAIHAALSSTTSDRFWAIRPLDRLDALDATVMEYVHHPTMQEELRRAFVRPILASKPHLTQAFENAGAWLWGFQELRPRCEPESRRARWSDIAVVGGRQLVELTRYGADAELLSVLRTVFDNVAQRRGMVPLGLSHGDFAPRNVFVGPRGKVAVIDALGRWRVPIYEDVAYFIVALRTSRSRVLSMGRMPSPQVVRLLESAFLKGYTATGGASVEPLPIFEVIHLLDRWLSLSVRSRRSRMPATLVDRMFYREVKHRIDRIALNNDIGL